MEDDEIRRALDRHWTASDKCDYEAEHEIYDEDAVLEYPQSGARIHGGHNIQLARMAQLSVKHFLIRMILGSKTLLVTEYIIQYNGVPSYTVSIMEFCDGTVMGETQYFGEPFKPSPSRARWVEPIEQSI
jgi:hypothetical protein